MTPPMFDIFNIQIWKVKMSMYLNALGIYAYFATIKDSYCLNINNLEANAKALHAFRSTLNDEYYLGLLILIRLFVIWNTLVSLCEQKQYYSGSDSDDESDASNICYMV